MDIKRSEITVNSVETSGKDYRDIKPERNMSVKDISDTVALEFNKLRDEEKAAQEDLFSEAFNRHEDEFNLSFDFNKEIKDILQKFNPENWEHMNDKERMSAVQDLARAIGDQLGIKKSPKIQVRDDMGDSLGNYDPKAKTVNLNSRYFDKPADLVDTIAHEMRHAYQHERAEKGETREDLIYKNNFAFYIEPLPLPNGDYIFFTDYYSQYVEAEARAFANLFKREML